jgi:hypothetical protein
METELFFVPFYLKKTRAKLRILRGTQRLVPWECPDFRSWRTGAGSAVPPKRFFVCRKFIGLAEKLKSNKLIFFPGRTINVPVPWILFRVSHSKVHLNRPGADPSLQIKIIDFRMASTARIFRRLPDSDSVDSVDSVESATCYPVLGQELH